MTAAEPIDETELLAGEYVLGTLDVTERTVVQAHRRDNAQLDAAIKRWEILFAPLAAAVAPIEPTEGLYAALARRIGAEAPAIAPAEANPSTVAPVPLASPAGKPETRPPVQPTDGRNVVRLTRSVRLWKTTTALVGTVAASLLIGIALSGQTPGGGHTLVALLQQSNGTPTFLVSVDLTTRALSVRRINAEVHPDKTYQLWLVSDKFDKVPKSLGLIGEGQTTVEHTLGSFDRAVVQDATYAISLEPRGGSPKSTPTGPALWTGRLVQASP